MNRRTTSLPWMEGTEKTGWPMLVMLCIAVALVFGQVCRFDFVAWDDNLNVYANPYLHPVTAENILRFWRAPYYELYTPLMFTFWALLAALRSPTEPVPGVPNPSAALFHGVSLLLHLANTLLIWRLIRLLLERLQMRRAAQGLASPDDSRVSPGLAAVIGAALFALHPQQVEPVVWVTGANNLLSALFTFVALLLYLEARTPGMRPARYPSLAYGLATVSFVMALLAKPIAATTSLVAVILDWSTGPVTQTAAERRKSLTIPAIWLILGLLDSLVTRFSSSSNNANIYLPIPGRPIIAGASLAFYLEKLAVPLGLVADYTRLPSLILGSWWGYADTIGVLVLGVLLWRFGGHIIRTAILVWLAALLPVIGFVPFYLHRWSTVGDRYEYVALLGPALAIAYFARFATTPSPRIRRGIGVLYVCLAVGWAALSARQAATWSATIPMLSQTLSVNPRSFVAWIKLGTERENAGDPDGAIDAIREGIRLKPDYPLAYFNLGSLLARRGQIDEGIEQLRMATRLEPTEPDGHSNLALSLEQKGMFAEAASELEEVLRLNPNYPGAADALAQARQLAASGSTTPLKLPPPEQDSDAAPENERGVALCRSGDFTGAIPAFRHAIHARPDFAAAFCNLGAAYASLGQYREAARAYRSAILRRPSWDLPRNALEALVKAGKL